MKKVKYLLCAVLAMMMGMGSVFAASITFPSTVEIKVGETKTVEVNLTDLAIIGEISCSEPSVVELSSNNIAFKTDGPGSKTETFTIKGLAVGEAVLTITSDDATIFSTEEEYEFQTTTVTVKVVESAQSTEEPTKGSYEEESTTTAVNSNYTEQTTTNKSSEQVSNPKTGVEDYILPSLIVIVALGGLFVVFKNVGLFKKI